MPNCALNYASDGRRRRIPARLLIIVMMIVAAYPAWLTLQWAALEYRLSRRESWLLSANAPQQCWPTVSITITPAGYLILPDGRLARLSQMLAPNNRPDLTAKMNLEMAGLLSHYRSERVGYTVLKTDPDGTPAVDVWALGPKAYGGLCGNSSYVEKRELSMRLWRNIGVFMAEEGAFPVDPNRPTVPMSVLGWD